MDFGEILDEWDRRRSRKSPETRPEDGSGSRSAAGKTKADGHGEKRSGRSAEPDGTAYLKRWLLRNTVPDPEEREGSAEKKDAAAKGRASAERIKRMRPQATLDLHGKTMAEAELAIGIFLTDAQRQGMEKVLIIHGKGLHSESEPVLASAVRKILEGTPMVGAFGPAARDSGGRGATWARIRRTDYFSR
ncbi:Endonuclease MutS2 [bioreactor metagenome]|jgi:DNA-nicking Smr family endonuclease|uniref:Endonuclease MutS2 n=1 Tax=bioreactor metagenome TaxID=1076179 RepID=A0A644SVY9_9ZZZZ